MEPKVIIETDTYKIKVDRRKKYIYYIFKSKKLLYSFSYNEALLAILCQVYPDVAYDNRLRFRKRHDKDIMRIYAHDLAIGCYSGRIKADSYIEDCIQFLDWKRKNGFVIDHIDSNERNNTERNISLMSFSQNARKSNIMKRVRLPNVLTGAHVNGQYRLELVSYPSSDVDNGQGRRILFLCKDAEEFVSRLVWIVNSRFEWAEPFKGTARRWITTTEPCLNGCLYRSEFNQEMLAEEDEDKFIKSGKYPIDRYYPDSETT